MKNKIIKSVFSVFLIFVLSLMPSGVSAAEAKAAVFANASFAADGAEIKSKDEVIYAVLSTGGSVDAIYAVNHFVLSKMGHITDYGNYLSAHNLTDASVIQNDNSSVSFYTESNNFYYQGNMASLELPWIFDISYSINGESLSAKEIAGKSGNLEILLKSSKNPVVNEVFYDNYMLQISLTLDSTKVGDIIAHGASVVSAGTNRIVAYTVLPGEEAELTLQATVRDFEMAGIDITAIPFQMDFDLPDTNAFIGDFELLADSVSALNDGIGELSSGIADMKSGAVGIFDGSSAIKKGLEELNGNNVKLTDASSKIKDALSQITSILDSSLDTINFDDLALLAQGLVQISEGLIDASSGLDSLDENFSLAYSALDNAIQNIPDTAITQEQIFALYAQISPDQYDLIDELVAQYTAAQTVKGTYYQIKEAFDAVGLVSENLSSSLHVIAVTLDNMATEFSASLNDLDLSNQLGALLDGLTELDGNYSYFHDGLKGYFDGVSKLAGSYTDFHKGLVSIGTGFIALDNGASDLNDGMGKLNSETSKLPETVQEKIEEMLDQYSGSGFKPVSFTSSQNENVELVQFVFKCEGISKPEAPKNEMVVESETFWDRLVALFK